MRLADVASDVRKARSRRSAAGRLACVLADCPTCHVLRPDPCRNLDDAPWASSGLHAARADLAAIWIERAP